MHTLLLLRHGESIFNAQQVFTGLLDVDLSDHGRQQLAAAAHLIGQTGLRPRLVVTSPLRRATETAEALCTKLELPSPHVVWRLAERDYGCLTGLSKAECRRRYGEEAFFTWRRTIDGKPPAATPEQVASWGPLAAKDVGPLTPGMSESLREVIARVEPFWRDLRGALHHADILVVGHGNSLRALCTLIDELSDEEVEQLNIPAGHPLRYEFAPDGRVVFRGYLDPVTAHADAVKVAAEGGT